MKTLAQEMRGLTDGKLGGTGNPEMDLSYWKKQGCPEAETCIPGLNSNPSPCQSLTSSPVLQAGYTKKSRISHCFSITE